MNRSQQDIIEYLQGEIPVLKEQLGKKPLFNDDQPRRLAIKGSSFSLESRIKSGIFRPQSRGKMTDAFGFGITALATACTFGS